MKVRLRRIVPLLYAKARLFWDSAMSEWCDHRQITRIIREEKLYKEAWLRAELWVNDGTFEEW